MATSITERVATLPKRVLELQASDQHLLRLEMVTKALSSSTRLEILRFLGNHTCSVSEIAEALGLPASTATLHINILEKAGLIQTDLKPASRGIQRVCARKYDQVIVHIPLEPGQQDCAVQVSMPLGAYVDARVVPTCGLLGEVGIIGHLDDPAAFYEPEHIYTQMLWFHCGYVEYRFPNRLPPGAAMESLELSLEVCSEAPLHHQDWPSDVTVWMNGVEIGSWTSPADFGGERGLLTPSWWGDANSQYGLLKVWHVTDQGSYVDGVIVSQVTLEDLDLAPHQFISIRIGVKEDARNLAGLNLFGSKFGNYPQDIVLTQRFVRC